ncbi:MAG: hypothetical protein QF704_17540, partial [Anaerolineales bacterium]|nr:hypothetical protein [Anaerolineales bacterium]
MRRVHNAYTTWHPATDNALGSHVYGTFSNDPEGTETFSIRYDNLQWSKIMFSSGDGSEYIVMARSVLENLVSEVLIGNDCTACFPELIAHSCANPDSFYVRSFYLDREDPGFRCTNYLYMEDSYQEINYEVPDLGANVYVNSICARGCLTCTSSFNCQSCTDDYYHSEPYCLNTKVFEAETFYLMRRVPKKSDLRWHPA